LAAIACEEQKTNHNPLLTVFSYTNQRQNKWNIIHQHYFLELY